jgi:hypothetical protein
MTLLRAALPTERPDSMLQRFIKLSGLDRDHESTAWFEDADAGPTQEEILHDMGLLLAIVLGFAVVVSAACSVG